MEWINANLVYIVAGLYVLDKVAKATPTKYDDFVVDVLGDLYGIITGKKKP